MRRRELLGTGAALGVLALAPTRLLAQSQEEIFTPKINELGIERGRPDAPVTIHLFEDYQCPACRRFKPVVDKVKRTYVDAGKIRLIFFDFPLTQHHANAMDAAMAARCAGAYGDYWAMHDRLFATQKEWAGSQDPTNQFVNLAREVGVKPEPFRQCLEEGKPRDVVETNRKIARELNIRSTPALIVGTQAFGGGASFDAVQEAIDAELEATEASGA